MWQKSQTHKLTNEEILHRFSVNENICHELNNVSSNILITVRNIHIQDYIMPLIEIIRCQLLEAWVL